MFNLVQKTNSQYWEIYIKKHKDTMYLLNSYFVKEEKRKNFINYLIRVKKPLFFKRFYKNMFFTKEKWLNIKKQKHQLRIYFKKIDKRRMNKYKNKKNHSIYKTKTKNNIYKKKNFNKIVNNKKNININSKMINIKNYKIL